SECRLTRRPIVPKERSRMAKGKHAAALFEVIHNDKRFAKKSSSGMDPLRTPTWWFKGRKGAQESQAGPNTPPAQNPSPVAHSPSTPAPASQEAPQLRLAEYDPTSPEALAARAAHHAAAHHAAAHHAATHHAATPHPAPLMTVPESIPYEPAPTRSAPNWSRRPEWLTRTSGAIIAGAAVAVVGLGV